ncbi:MAG: peptidoglycan-binding protein, partial [Erysipelotrichaceae bacterium]|nr:peptidoglycan-binding protein [Erysipelotrichaceae bacterium]
MLNYPIIPKYVTVHLGRPTASASNVTVSFRDYIKNVASSEIYPTWPEQSLRANIYCQISLVMNRVYTEWYRSKGYSFDITNSTAFDQYYVHNRNIFENISRIVDEIFNTYIRKLGTINPYYAEYCDGRQVWCNGLKQWGTVDLANKGYNAFEILKYYYGSDIELITTNRIEGVSGSYPGYSLKRGMRSDAVATIQAQLNRIAVNYPIIPVIYPVDGIFGAQTEAAVKAFQKQFNLAQDGIVGNSTWYKISYIYVAVKKLAELSSEGVQAGLDFEYPGTPLREGTRSIKVQEIQFFLNKIALFTTRVPSIKIDSYFGSGTKAAVIAFQRLAGLTPDG